jgi:hypothetical protein
VPRYYQQIAIHRVIESILLGQKRILATLATGTGKTCRCFPDLLEALEQPLEPHGRVPASQDPVPGRPQHPG